MIIPIDPKNCTVNGHLYKGDSPTWLGLDMANAELRSTSTLMEIVCGGQNVPADHHLYVPFCHPDDAEDAADAWIGCKYRVRPRRKKDHFVMVDGSWMLHRHEPKRR